MNGVFSKMNMVVLVLLRGGILHTVGAGIFLIFISFGTTSISVPIQACICAELALAFLAPKGKLPWVLHISSKIHKSALRGYVLPGPM